MLHIVAWLAVYAVVLFALGEVVRPLRTRRWFKTLFLPGVLIAIGVQAAAARMCIGGRFKMAPLKSGEAVFFLEKKDVPCLAGALFVLVSHLLFYALFFTVVRMLEATMGVDTDAIALPGLHPHQALEGTIEVDTRSYFANLRSAFGQFLTNPIPFLAIFYLAAPVFANFRLCGREFFWAALLVLVLGYPVYFADRLGIGFPFLSRGWWARFFVFPEWWGIFSLYVTTALATLALALVPGLGRLFATTLKSDKSDERKATLDRKHERRQTDRRSVPV